MLDGKIVICRGRRMKYRLIEICAGITDGSHNPPAGGCKSDYMMISSKNVFDDEITLDDPRYLTEDQFNQENNRTRVASGDVLMTIVGTVGRTAVVPNDFVNITLQRSVAVFHTNNDICKSRYLMYLLRAKRHYFESEAHGVAQKGIYLKQLSDVMVDIPEIAEQTHILDILDHLQKVIFLRKQELIQLNEIVKARFVEMFGTLHDNENGFEVVTIEDVCSLMKDGTHQTPQYTENKEEGFKFLSSKDVMSQKIDWTDIKYIPAELHEKLYATIKPQRNDILMSKNGVNYGVAAVNDTDEIFDIYVSLALLRPKEEIDPVFLRCVINNPETKRQFDSSIKGIGVPNLHLGEIRKTKIFLPPIELQKEFVLFVDQVDKSKAAVQKSLDETQVLFDSLMQKYFG